MLGPMINIARVPRGGRNFESFGEDPFLAGQMAAASVTGIQSTGVMACAKHFVVGYLSIVQGGREGGGAGEGEVSICSCVGVCN
jgi:hypothetical protein